jgi:hypothetical protein
MHRVVVKSRVGSDGVLHLAVPVGKTNADREVRVVVEASGPSPMTQEQWRDFVFETAGTITDPTFVRHEQGEYEVRDELP